MSTTCWETKHVLSHADLQSGSVCEYSHKVNSGLMGNEMRLILFLL
jgi:hypothetical protein